MKSIIATIDDFWEQGIEPFPKLFNPIASANINLVTFSGDFCLFECNGKMEMTQILIIADVLCIYFHFITSMKRK